MYVQVTGDPHNQRVVVMGEPLGSCQEDGYYLLPGRLVAALKPEDLPVGMAFRLQGALPSGYGFYREDSVVFRRRNDSSALWIEVTSTYVISEWDGLFSLDATVQARRAVIEQHPQLAFVLCEKMSRSCAFVTGSCGARRRRRIWRARWKRFAIQCLKWRRAATPGSGRAMTTALTSIDRLFFVLFPMI